MSPQPLAVRYLFTCLPPLSHNARSTYLVDPVDPPPFNYVLPACLICPHIILNHHDDPT